MSEFTSKFVDEGAPTRASGDDARQPVNSSASDGTAAASTRSPPAFFGWQRSARRDYAMAVIVVAALAVAAFVLGRLGASRLPAPSSAGQGGPQQAASSHALTPADPAKLEAEPRAAAAQPGAQAAIPFVQVAVEPPHGEIWLDQTVAGVGSVQLGAIDDGELHELRFIAPGYETTTLIFRNTPPPGRVVLRPIARHHSAAGAPMPRSETARSDRSGYSDRSDRSDTARSEAPATRRHDPPNVERATRRVDADVEPSNRVASDPAVAAQPAPPSHPPADDAPKVLPRVKLIEVHIPRVEVLD